MNEKQKCAFRAVISILITVFMVAVAELTDEKEIIFPEIAALVTGALALSSRPWNVSLPRFVCLMSISAIFGVWISSLSMMLYLKVILGLVIIIVLLYLFRSTLVPAISSCILPILMGTTGTVYPVTVAALSLIIALTAALFEKKNIKSKNVFVESDRKNKSEIKRIVVLLFAVAIYSIYPCFSSNMLFIAPPLIVTFFEVFSKERKFENKELKLFATIALCAVAGTLSRYILCVLLPLGSTVSVLATSVFVVEIFVWLKIPFPPAAALSVLPLIISENHLIVYPFCIIITSAIILLSSVLYGHLKQFRISKKEAEH